MLMRYVDRVPSSNDRPAGHARAGPRPPWTESFAALFALLRRRSIPPVGLSGRDSRWGSPRPRWKPRSRSRLPGPAFGFPDSCRRWFAEGSRLRLGNACGMGEGERCRRPVDDPGNISAVFLSFVEKVDVVPLVRSYSVVATATTRLPLNRRRWKIINAIVAAKRRVTAVREAYRAHCRRPGSATSALPNFPSVRRRDFGVPCAVDT